MSMWKKLVATEKNRVRNLAGSSIEMDKAAILRTFQGKEVRVITK